MAEDILTKFVALTVLNGMGNSIPFAVPITAI